MLNHLTDKELLGYYEKYKDVSENSIRAERTKIDGADYKFLYHVVRLLLEAEMILEEGNIDIQRHKKHFKAIRRGEISVEDIRKWATAKELHLEKLYSESKLRHSPDEARIKELLLSCLKMHYGDLSKYVQVIEKDSEKAISEICDVIRKYNF